MGRASRRRAENRVVGTGVNVEAPRSKIHAEDPFAAPPGRHLWTVLAVWRLSDESAARSAIGGQVQLDTENLLTLEGPGCIVCERPYAEASGRPCPGDPP
jgi:hypothetical protein